MSGALIYLFGYPGVGKNTVAKEMGDQSDVIAIQNHLISNAFRHVLAGRPREEYAALEPAVKHHTMKAWLNFLEFIDKAAPDRALVFTSVLYQNEPDRVEYFEFIRKWAATRNRPFYPVRLRCSREEILRRAQSPNRSPEFKLTDADVLNGIIDQNTLLSPDDKNFIDLDVTAIPAKDVARKILALTQQEQSC